MSSLIKGLFGSPRTGPSPQEKAVQAQQEDRLRREQEQEQEADRSRRAALRGRRTGRRLLQFQGDTADANALGAT